MTEDASLLLRARRAKLDALAARGAQPFAYSFDRSHTAADAVASFDPDRGDDGPPVRVAGRLVAWRGHGKTAFAHLADESGRIQLYFRKDHLTEDAFAIVELLDIGDFVGVSGPLFKTRTGEITIRADAVDVLAKSLRPLPFGKEESVDGVIVRHSGFADPEQRFRQR
jgi:lysyl-tRNA synthetase class 2